MTLLFAMLIMYPDHIFFLRGNHEFETMNANYGFFAKVSAQYQSLYETFNAVFEWMPLVADLLRARRRCSACEVDCTDPEDQATAEVIYSRPSVGRRVDSSM
jgi:hypothetical protein